jgi:anti-anti-sigma factor
MAEYQQVEIEESGAMTIVRFRQSRLSGILELEKLEQELDQVLRGDHHTRLVLDFTPVQFISSELLGKLVAINRQVKARGGVLRLCGMPPRVLDVLLTCRMDTILDIRKDLAEALAAG